MRWCRLISGNFCLRTLLRGGHRNGNPAFNVAQVARRHKKLLTQYCYCLRTIVSASWLRYPSKARYGLGWLAKCRLRIVRVNGAHSISKIWPVMLVHDWGWDPFWQVR